MEDFFWFPFLRFLSFFVAGNEGEGPVILKLLREVVEVGFRTGGAPTAAGEAELVLRVPTGLVLWGL